MITMSAQSFFFFQAEDGIRDLIVTGVQTCALPISLLVVYLLPPTPPNQQGPFVQQLLFNIDEFVVSVEPERSIASFQFQADMEGAAVEIGRASCRERV